MSRTAHQPEEVMRPVYPYSPVVADGDVVVTAGQVGIDLNGELAAGVEAQTRQALENLRSCLRAAGCDLNDALRVNAYLADLDDFGAFNAVYKNFFAEPYPTRTTVGVSLPGAILVEVDAIAGRRT